MSEYELLDLACESKAFESKEAADRTITATLSALGASVSPGNRRDIAKYLPEHYAANIREAEGEATTPLDLEAFLDRVQTEADIEHPKPKVRVVLASLIEVVGEDVISDVRDQLPPEYGTLFEPATVEPGRSFVDVVAEKGEFDDETAESAARETLAVLGHRLSEGEALDITPYLRGEASSWLSVRATHNAEAFSPEEFIERIAARADVSEDRAREYAGAVADALVETVPEAEREHAAAQLPDQYASVIALDG
ncbi:DUF2267 domain-containing protein [Halolamina salifodinae]|uniref:Uncharacterized protein (DUF2267 family) n=1 Tax=Halolamina salifodinae TaxID=1202767 RepID=A0A8T4GZ91_9EURY|nr:DUF2267 domain-containing protein [Halolamina salifodinae]MBP1987740.1 uncharacterized protein (DUF2267 family) [Halolamina salifodinae]